MEIQPMEAEKPQAVVYRALCGLRDYMVAFLDGPDVEPLKINMRQELSKVNASIAHLIPTPWFCCELMERWSRPCEQHTDNPMDCPDQLIYFTKTAEVPGIRIHDGGSSFVVIAFCPWCGSRLMEDSGLPGYRTKEMMR